MNKYWEFKNVVDNSVDLYIYGEIDSYDWDDTVMTANKFKEELDTLGDVKKINLYINSVGGSVFQGLSIGNMIKRHNAKVTCHIDGLAASIASVIACSCDKVVMPKNSMLMVHNALCGIVGNATDLRKMADDLEKMSGTIRQTYVEKSNGKATDDKFKELMDNETWLTADESFELGLCDKVEQSNKMVAKIDVNSVKNFKNVPTELMIEEVQVKEAENKTNTDELELLELELELL